MATEQGEATERNEEGIENMANVCSFEIAIKGSFDGMKQMIAALKGDGPLIVGRGADFQSVRYEDEHFELSGSCPWSIYAALAHYEGIERSIYGHRMPGRDVIGLSDACERLGVNLEIYAEEESCDHFEHYKYENGEITEEYQDKPYKGWKFNLDFPCSKEKER